MINQNFGMRYRILIEKKDKDGNVEIIEDTKFLPTSDNQVVDFFMDLFAIDYDSLEFKNRNMKSGG